MFPLEALDLAHSCEEIHIQYLTVILRSVDCRLSGVTSLLKGGTTGSPSLGIQKPFHFGMCRWNEFGMVLANSSTSIPNL